MFVIDIIIIAVLFISVPFNLYVSYKKSVETGEMSHMVNSIISSAIAAYIIARLWP